jgi:hypothetical protein
VVLFINIPKFKESFSLTAKMVDVENGSILWMGSGEGTTGKTLATIAGAAAGAVVGVAVSGHDDRVLGGIAGGVLGGAAGNLLTPNQEKAVRQVTTKICKTLPDR